MIRRLSPFQWTLAAIAAGSLALTLCIGFLWIRNQLAIHELQTRLGAADFALSQGAERDLGPFFSAEPIGLRLLDLTARSARMAGLEVASVRSSPASPEQLGRNMYLATQVSVQLTGDINEIVAFLDLMESAAISSMTIEDFELKWADAHWEVSLNVFAYAMPG